MHFPCSLNLHVLLVATWLGLASNFSVNGNPFCWDGQFNFESCCRDPHGSCWIHPFTFSSCCYSEGVSWMVDSSGNTCAYMFVATVAAARASNMEHLMPVLPETCDLKHPAILFSHFPSSPFAEHNEDLQVNEGCHTAGGSPVLVTVLDTHSVQLNSQPGTCTFILCAPEACRVEDVAATLVPWYVITKLDSADSGIHRFLTVVHVSSPVETRSIPAKAFGGDQQPIACDSSRIMNTGVVRGIPPGSLVAEGELYQSFLVCGECDLRRFGSANDGGYLMCAPLAPVTAAYSYGINGKDDWGTVVSHAVGAVVYQYDCENTSVPPACDLPCRAIFHPECIGGPWQLNERFKHTLGEHLDRNGHRDLDQGRLLLKMDVETFEWEAFALAADYDLQLFSQIVVEFHCVALFQDAVNMGVRLKALRNLLRNFTVVHVHRSNFHQNSSNLEVTFAQRHLVKPVACRLPQRHILDAPTNPSIPDEPSVSEFLLKHLDRVVHLSSASKMLD